MSRLVYLMLALALIFSPLSTAPVQAAKGPDIQFDQTEWSFNQLKEGQKVKAEFTFTNKGDMNLIIDKVSPSCSCTVPSFDRVVKPGQKGSVTIDLDTEGITGAFRKTAVVATNDASKPFVTLVMIGETQSRIKVDKGRRIKVSGCLGTDVSTTATLTDPDGKNILIAGIENPMSDYLEASLKAQPGGKAYTLTLRVIADMPINFAGPIFFRVPGQGKISLYVVAEVRGPFAVQPHEVYFGGLTQNGYAPTRTILIRKDCAEKLDLQSLEYNEDLFEVKKTWQEEDAKLLLEVKPLMDKLVKGPFQETISIQAQGKAFDVHLRGVVR